jgi:hypothetical protein
MITRPIWKCPFFEIFKVRYTTVGINRCIVMGKRGEGKFDINSL